MSYQTKNFDNLLGLVGFSDQILKNHFTLYQGYVNNSNKLLETLSSMLKEKKFTPEYAELKRRFGWEFNGMRLHEIYFSSLSKIPKQINKNSSLFKQIVKDFGSYMGARFQSTSCNSWNWLGYTLL